MVFAVRHEYCLRLSDFLRRRTLLGTTADQGMDAAEPAAMLMARELGWSDERRAEEVADYRREIEESRRFRTTADGQPNHSDRRPTPHAPRPS